MTNERMKGRGVVAELRRLAKRMRAASLDWSRGAVDAPKDTSAFSNAGCAGIAGGFAEAARMCERRATRIERAAGKLKGAK